MSGRFITIEGQDGAGKSTNIEVIKSRLEHAGIDYQLSREPGGTKLGETLRQLLLNDKDDEVGDLAELLIIFAARAQHLQEVIEPSLASGKWLICDRFTDATFAYQGGGRGMNVKTISQLQQLVQGERRPDLTILLDLPEKISAQRADARSVPDRFEAQAADFKRSVRASYLELAENEPERIKVVDASRTLDGVKQTVSELIDAYIESEHG